MLPILVQAVRSSVLKALVHRSIVVGDIDGFTVDNEIKGDLVGFVDGEIEGDLVGFVDAEIEGDLVDTC